MSLEAISAYEVGKKKSALGDACWELHWVATPGSNTGKEEEETFHLDRSPSGLAGTIALGMSTSNPPSERHKVSFTNEFIQFIVWYRTRLMYRHLTFICGTIPGQCHYPLIWVGQDMNQY